MDATVGGIGAVVVAELRAAGYMESTVGQYAKTIKALTEFASGHAYFTSLGCRLAGRSGRTHSTQRLVRMGRAPSSFGCRTILAPHTFRLSLRPE